MKDKLGGKIMKEFAGLRRKTCSYLIDDTHKKCVIKRKLKFKNYKNCLEATQTENKISLLEKMKLTYIVLRKIIKNS